LATFERIYSKLPPTQTVPGTTMVNKPSIPASTAYDLYKNGSLVRAAAGGLYSNTHLFDFSSQTSYDIFGTVLVPVWGFVGAPTSGTWDFTYKGSTTTRNYNDSNATVAAAINALASIIADGITVTVINGPFATTGLIQVRPTVGAWLAEPTVSGASLGPALAQTIDVYVSGADRIVSTRSKATFTSAHGVSDTAKPIALRSSAVNIIASGKWSVFDSTTLLFSQGAVAGTANLIAPYLRNYTPGSAPTPCSFSTRFSLSAIIPDAYQGEGDAFLQAIFSGDTTINYRVGDQSRWPMEQSPINSMTTTIVSAADL
jgi:hypothetical protein